MATARNAEPPVDVPDVVVEVLLAEHWTAVREIYAEGLATGHASFEIEPPSWEDFRAGHLPDHQLVAHDDRSRNISVLPFRVIHPAPFIVLVLVELVLDLLNPMHRGRARRRGQVRFQISEFGFNHSRPLPLPGRART